MDQLGSGSKLDLSEVDDVEILNDADLVQLLLDFDNSNHEGFGKSSPDGEEDDKKRKDPDKRTNRGTLGKGKTKKKKKKLVQTTLPFFRKNLRRRGVEAMGRRGRTGSGSEVKQWGEGAERSADDYGNRGMRESVSNGNENEPGRVDRLPGDAEPVAGPSGESSKSAKMEKKKKKAVNRDTINEKTTSKKITKKTPVNKKTSDKKDKKTTNVKTTKNKTTKKKTAKKKDTSGRSSLKGREEVNSDIKLHDTDDENGDPMEMTAQNYKLTFWRTRNVGVTQTLRVSFERGTVEETIYRLTFNERFLGQRLVDIMENIEEAFSSIVNRLRQNYGSRDLVRVCVLSPSFHIPQILSLRPLGELLVSDVLDLLEKVTQSEGDLLLEDGFQIHIAAARNPAGDGKRSRGYNIFLTDRCDVYRNRSSVKIRAKDRLCFSRSVAVALARAKMEDIKRNQGDSSQDFVEAKALYTKIRDSRLRLQLQEAQKIQELAGMSTNQAVALTDIPKFEESMDLRIVVIAPHIQNKVIYAGRKRGFGKLTLFLLYIRSDFFNFSEQVNACPDRVAQPEERHGHFQPITKISGFYRCGFFCPDCLQPSSDEKKHSCYSHCNLCLHSPCPYVTTEAMICPDCHRCVRSKACLSRHKKSTVCSEVAKCPTCMRVYERSSEGDHECGVRTCKICEERVTEEHFCSMRALTPKEVGYKYMFADFEANPHDSGHTANLLIAQWCCQACVETSYRQEPKCSHCGLACEKCSGKVDKKISKGEDERQVCMKTDQCGIRRVEIFGDDVPERFCKFFFNDEHKGYTLLFHNFQGYDSYFLMSYICQMGIAPSVIYRGSKIISVTIGGRLNIRLIDSLSFLTMPLSAMPEVFMLEGIRKGTFPYKFNVPQNYSYIGSYPDPHYYGVEQMKPAAREAFLKWYSEQSGKIFDFKKEILEYCRSDVCILEEACMSFRRHIVDLTKKEVVCDFGDAGSVETKLIAVDPLAYNTMAGVCMAIFRYMFLQECHLLKLSDGREVKGILQNDEWKNVTDENGEAIDLKHVGIETSKFLYSPIARMPSGGFATRDTYSQKAVQWVTFESFKTGLYIQHALTPEGEFKIHSPKTPRGFYKADGYCRETNTVFEYRGCCWHACDMCFPYDFPSRLADSLEDPYPKHPHTGQTMRELSALTKIRDQNVREALPGCKIVTKMECEFKKEIAASKELQDFLKENPVRPRLDPRESLFGGRVNAIKLYVDCQKTGMEGKKIAYADITSLYPTVLKYDRFPVGVPKVILNPDTTDISDFFGIVFCRVRAPRKLYHPVLPTRTKDKKLLFGLCRFCMENSSQKRCKCPHERRDLVGTWCTIELEMALSKGYRIIQIFEVYHFQETSTDIFSGYVDLFVKGKQEASGWPREGMTDEEKDDYLKKYFEVEGIMLEKDRISKNPGARKVSKQVCNSLWGKFGEVVDRKKHVLVNNAENFYRYITDQTLEIEDFHVLAPETCQVEYKHKSSSSLPECSYVNTFIASFTTANGRMRLYRELDKLGDRVIYMDTDSIVYTYQSVEGEPHPPYGEYLGQWTNELKPGDSITQFVSAGPKSYAYKTALGDTIVKVKGITITHSASQVINFESIKNLVLHYADPQMFPLSENERAEIEVNYPSKIHRDRFNFTLYGKNLKKKFRVTYGKRQLVRDGSFDTIPYGY